MAGRLAGTILPALGMAGLTYGIGKLSGQDDQSAILSAIGGVGGALGGEYVMHRAFPNASVNLNVNQRQIPIHYAGKVGALAGGYLGSELAKGTDYVLKGGHSEESEAGVNPLLLAADDLAIPAISIAKAFL